MGQRVKSELDESIDYDFEFYDNTLKESDKGIQSDLYQINIFGNDYVIAIGNQNIHKENNNLIYFNVYLIYKNKVIFKIGIYELLEESVNKIPNINNKNTNFESLKLLIDNQFYKQPYSLDPFISVIENKNTSNTKNQGEEELEELEEGETETLNEFKVNHLFDFTLNDKSESESLKDMYMELQNEIDGKDLYKLINNIYRTKPKSGVGKEDGCVLENIVDKNNQRILDKLFRSFMDSYLKLSSKTGLNYSFENEVTKESPIVLTIPALLLLEFKLNLKIIVINHKNKLTGFSILGNVPDIDKYKNDKYVCNAFKSYNPTNIAFVKQDSNDLSRYRFVKYNNQIYQSFSDLDEKIQSMIKLLYTSTKHEYNIDNDEDTIFMKVFKEFISELSNENMSNLNINNEPPLYSSKVEKSLIKKKSKPKMDESNEKNPENGDVDIAIIQKKILKKDALKKALQKKKVASKQPTISKDVVEVGESVPEVNKGALEIEQAVPEVVQSTNMVIKPKKKIKVSKSKLLKLKSKKANDE